MELKIIEKLFYTNEDFDELDGKNVDEEQNKIVKFNRCDRLDMSIKSCCGCSKTKA